MPYAIPLWNPPALPIATITPAAVAGARRKVAVVIASAVGKIGPRKKPSSNTAAMIDESQIEAARNLAGGIKLGVIIT